MKRIGKLATIISHDKSLQGLLSGMVLCGVALMGVIATVCIWYL